MQAVNLPQTAANPVANHRVSQLFTHRDANAVFVLPIGSGVQDKVAVGHSGGVIQPAENMIEF